MKTFPVYLSKESIRILKLKLKLCGLKYPKEKELYNYLDKVEKSYESSC